jgi:hypothetical protein
LVSFDAIRTAVDDVSKAGKQILFSQLVVLQITNFVVGLPRNRAVRLPVFAKTPRELNVSPIKCYMTPLYILFKY